MFFSGDVKKPSGHQRKGSRYVELRSSALGACYKVMMVMMMVTMVLVMMMRPVSKEIMAR